MRRRLENEFWTEYEFRRQCFLGGGGSGGGKSTTVQQQQLTPEQQQLFGLGLPFAQSFAGSPIQDAPGPRLAPLDPLELAAQQQALDTRGQLGNLAQGSLGFQGFLQSDALNPENNPGLQGAISAATRPLQEQFSQTILPGIRGEARQAGALGGSRQGIAEGLAARDLQRTTGDVTSNLVFQAYQNAIDNATKAQFASPQLGDLALAPSRISAGVGAQRRLEDQLSLDEALRQFNFQQFAPLLQAQSVIGLANQFPGAGSTSSTNQSSAGGAGGTVRGALGGAATGASLGSFIAPGWGTLGGGVLGALLGGFL